MYLLEFTIPGLPKTTNSGGRAHWAVKTKEARIWKAHVWTAITGKMLAYPLERAQLTLIRHSASEPDYDGLVSSFKHVIDALVEVKVLVNDRQSNIGQSKYQWQKASPGKGCITVKIEEVV